MRRFLAALFRRLAEALVRLYYPARVVEGGERIPSGKPAGFRSQSPERAARSDGPAGRDGRPARFLAKSTLFRNPLSRLAMDAFGSIPVYRAKESGARAADASRNDESFARCRAELAAGGALALFPEGVSHSDPQLRPLKTGAARIALSAEAEHDGKLGVTVVPVGLYYERKAMFRSSVLLVVGEPIAVAALLGDYRRDERAAVAALTETIDARLDEVVLQAESRELLAGIARVARWTSDRTGDRTDDDGAQDLAAQHRARARAGRRVRAAARARSGARRGDRRRGARLHARAAAAGRARSRGRWSWRRCAPRRAGGGVRQDGRRGAAGGDRRGDGLASVPPGGRGRASASRATRTCSARSSCSRARCSWRSRGGGGDGRGLSLGAAVGGADVRRRRRDRLRRAALRGAAARGGRGLAPGDAARLPPPDDGAPRRAAPRARRRGRARPARRGRRRRRPRRSRSSGSLRAQVVEDDAGHGPRRRAAAGGRLRSGPREHDLDVRRRRAGRSSPSGSGRA